MMKERTRQRTISRTASQAAAQDREPTGIRGTVKAIKKQEGYGFVTHAATGEDYFFHRSEARDSDIPFDELKPDQEVVFEPSDGPKGLRAQNVRAV